MSPREVHAVVNRVRSEFIEMPGLRLTLPQAARLWGLDPPACENRHRHARCERQFLRWTAAGTVARIES